jgi:antibiotic biosynthesis monooxygenase (ABM) superfamily enzyme
MDDDGSPVSWLELLLILVLLFLVFSTLNTLLRPYVETILIPALCERYGLFCPGG